MRLSFFGTFLIIFLLAGLFFSAEAATTGQSQGKIAVSSTPGGATILLDGKSMGVTPAVLSGITPGNHRVVLKMTGYQDSSTNAKVSGGTTKTVSVNLARAIVTTARQTTLPTVTSSTDTAVLLYTKRSSSIEVTYPKKIRASTSTDTGGSVSYVWKYKITFRDTSGQGFSLTSRNREYYVPSSGRTYVENPYRTSIKRDIGASGSYTDSGSIQSTGNTYGCELCNGQAKFTYYGKNAKGNDIEIPLTMTLVQ
jgi:hypothetical protein